MDELEAARQLLREKRLQLGLTETGERPQEPLPPTLGATLKAVLANPEPPKPDGGGLASTIFHSKDACTQTCPTCGRHLEPISWGEPLGQELWAPSNCPECWPKRQAEQAEQEAAQKRFKRWDLYQRAFPFNPNQMRAETLPDFERRPGSETAVTAVRRYIDGLPNPDPPGLLIHGEPGNGKSNLAAIVASEARRQKVAVAWIRAYDWLRQIGSMKPDERESLLDLACSAELVILDDLGARRPTGPQAEWALAIIDAAYRRHSGIVVTTNHKPDDLADAMTPAKQGPDEADFMAGTRIVDRLAEMSVFVENRATSYRMELAEKRLLAMTEGV